MKSILWCRGTAAVLAAATLIGAACSDIGGPGGDRKRPTLITSSPANGATHVPVTATVTITFSEDIRATSVTPTTVTITPAVDGEVHAIGELVTFTPATRYDYSTTYTVTLTTGVRDLAGNAIAGTPTIVFTTVANAAPVASATPELEVARGVTVTLDARESNDPESGTLTYTWTQTAGADVTGGTGTLTGAQPTITAPGAITTLRFSLVVRDPENNASVNTATSTIFVVESPGATRWMAPGGNDANPGTRALPLRTLVVAISRAAAANADLYIQAGEHTVGGVTLSSGVSLYGGYSTTWTRDASGPTTITTSSPYAVRGEYVSDLTIERLRIVTGNAGPHTSTYGILMWGGRNVQIRNNEFIAGAGGPGGQGGAGTSGVEGGAGNPGTNGACDDLNGSGGDGGFSFGNGLAGGSGGRGGLKGDNPGVEGSMGGGSTGGRGGFGGPGGNPGGRGEDGLIGSPGLSGANGVAGPALGELIFVGYFPTGGNSGETGVGGSGGGGGGGGGGQGGVSVVEGGGNGGGGGGAGGAGGKGGFGGSGGGGSLGIVLVGTINTIVHGNSITTGNGGNGGAGGVGGSGGTGGAGGAGASWCTGEIGAGGNGGAGGRGGNGGTGAGGEGGPSIGIFEDATTTGITVTNNTFTIGNAGTGGVPGGAPGVRANQWKVSTATAPARRVAP